MPRKPHPFDWSDPRNKRKPQKELTSYQYLYHFGMTEKQRKKFDKYVESQCQKYHKSSAFMYPRIQNLVNKHGLDLYDAVDSAFKD
jgi:hypothetical protein